VALVGRSFTCARPGESADAEAVAFLKGSQHNRSTTTVVATKTAAGENKVNFRASSQACLFKQIALFNGARVNLIQKLT
jgi:hypothetical protein